MHPKSLIHRNLVAFAIASITDFDKVAEVSAPLFKAGTAKCPSIESTSLDSLYKGYNSFSSNCSNVSLKQVILNENLHLYCHVQENASNSLKRLHHSVRASIPKKIGLPFFVFTKGAVPNYRIIH
jgi:hypothetical protein